MDANINIYEIANTRKRLMEKYLKGIITSEEMMILNIIEQEIDTVIRQRKGG